MPALEVLTKTEGHRERGTEMSQNATSQPTMNMSQRIRRLALAAATAAIIAVPATQAFAMDNVTDPGIRCAAKVGPGEYEFYLPGEKATDVNGNKWVCGPDGQWFRDYSALVKTSVLTLSPLRTTSLSSFTVVSR